MSLYGVAGGECRRKRLPGPVGHGEPSRSSPPPARWAAGTTPSTRRTPGPSAKGLTLNLGVRLDKENLPSYNTLPGFNGISFGWGRKIAPRLGAAYDVLHNGKVKVYGSFGYFYDIMKYQLPRGSFGGDYWHDCVYALDSPDFNADHSAARFAGPLLPAGRRQRTPPSEAFRPCASSKTYDYREPANDPNQAGSLGTTGLVDPNLKPMKQHVITIGASWELKHDLVFEPVYTRTRLDRTIEDAGTITQDGEIYYIINPGFGDQLRSAQLQRLPAQPKADPELRRPGTPR